MHANSDISYFAAGREKGFALMRRFLKAVAALALLLAFSLESGVPARGQLIGVGRGRGRRIGRVVLPTPPFNPDAGILDRPKGRGRDTPKTAPPRSINRRKHSYNQKPRPGTARGRRARRGRAVG